jgi:thiol-disulfide isomerase/thioredoxin
MQNSISKKFIENSISYLEYRHLIDKLLLENKTTGADQSDALIAYAKLNQQRMRRLEKKLMLNISLKNTIFKVNKKYIILALTEGWCGDAAQILPVFEKIGSENKNLIFKILLRDNNLELMDQHLTNGTRSIPKILFIDEETYTIKNSWGPRPIEAQKLIDDLKKENISVDDIKTQLHTWYAKDKTEHTQNEIVEVLQKLG